MNSLEDILALDVEKFHTNWKRIDSIVSGLKSRREQIQAWEKIRDKLDAANSPKGHPLFRVKTQLTMLRFNGLVNRIGGPTDAGELVLV